MPPEPKGTLRASTMLVNSTCNYSAEASCIALGAGSVRVSARCTKFTRLV